MMPAMTRPKDPIRNYGINHFFWKYGIQYDDAKLKMVYGDDKVDRKFVIRILKNEIKDKIMGNMIIAKSGVPLFECPIEVEGRPLAWFSENFPDKRSYVCAAIRDKKEIIIGFDIFNEVGHILSGHLETLWSYQTKDIHRLARIPVVDVYEKFLFDCLMMASDLYKIKLSFKPLWPGDKKFAVCLTHDVDIVKKSYQYGTHFFRQLKKRNFFGAKYQLKSLFSLGKYPDPYWNFEKIMVLEAALKLRSTFFFLNGKKIPAGTGMKAWLEQLKTYNLDNPKLLEAIRRLNQNGWEIGLHGRYSSDRGEMLLRNGKSKIEGIIGGQIHGIRQHYLDFTIPEIWQMQEKAGFKYDSSIGFRDKIGFRFGTCFPFYPFDINSKKQINVLEIPLIIMDATVISRKDTWEECKRMVDTVKKYGGVFTINWHQRVFNENEFPGWKKTYIEIVKYCSKENAWVEPIRSVYRWWENKWSK